MVCLDGMFGWYVWMVCFDNMSDGMLDGRFWSMFDTMFENTLDSMFEVMFGDHVCMRLKVSGTFDGVYNERCLRCFGVYPARLERRSSKQTLVTQAPSSGLTHQLYY